MQLMEVTAYHKAKLRQQQNRLGHERRYFYHVKDTVWIVCRGAIGVMKYGSASTYTTGNCSASAQYWQHSATESRESQKLAPLQV